MLQIRDEVGRSGEVGSNCKVVCGVSHSLRPPIGCRGQQIRLQIMPAAVCTLLFVDRQSMGGAFLGTCVDSVWQQYTEGW